MFVHHINDLKNNEYIPVCDRKKVVTCSDGKYQLVSNVCPHQKSLISTKKGRGARVCPYHGWSFQLDGTPISNGRTECKNQTALASTPLYEWNGLLFTQPVDCEKFADFSNLELVEQRIDTVLGDAITIMDVFLDVDHIPVVHRGVYDQLGLTNVTQVDWTYYDWGSLQSVPRNTGFHEGFESTLLAEDHANHMGAAWLAVYPGTMIEWQPGAVFITVTGATENNLTPVHVFKYRDTRYSDDNWSMNERMWELAWYQDKELVSLITEVSSDNLELQKLHFRKSLKT